MEDEVNLPGCSSGHGVVGVDGERLGKRRPELGTTGKYSAYRASQHKRLDEDGVEEAAKLLGLISLSGESFIDGEMRRPELGFPVWRGLEREEEERMRVSERIGVRTSPRPYRRERGASRSSTAARKKRHGSHLPSGRRGRRK